MQIRAEKTFAAVEQGFCQTQIALPYGKLVTWRPFSTLRTLSMLWCGTTRPQLLAPCSARFALQIFLPAGVI